MCSSTCTLFAEAMREVGVRTAVYGGQNFEGDMQFIGGVEGSEVVPFSLLAGLADIALEYNKEQAEREGWSEVLPQQVPGDGKVNLRNTFRAGNDVPLEFVYTKADWHLPFTREMWDGVDALWKRVAEGVWGVEGG